mmetsp:Transcript_98610/g.317952  ORF Transcript_98610/g.317952 Transcript_98610/m.317952 type:complete len:188 (+) Transcript_98610:68-631(+)
MAYSAVLAACLFALVGAEAPPPRLHFKKLKEKAKVEAKRFQDAVNVAGEVAQRVMEDAAVHNIDAEFNLHHIEDKDNRHKWEATRPAQEKARQLAFHEKKVTTEAERTAALEKRKEMTVKEKTEKMSNAKAVYHALEAQEYEANDEKKREQQAMRDARAAAKWAERDQKLKERKLRAAHREIVGRTP